MMFEPIFLILFIISLTLAIFPDLLTKKLIFIIYIFCALFLHITLRYGIEFRTGDMPGYYASIERLSQENYLSNFTNGDMNSLQSKEILFWYPAVAIFELSNSLYFSIIIFDIILYLSLYFGVKKILECQRFKTTGSTLTSLYFVCLLYVPFLQNISSNYRQAIASSLIILSLGLFLEKKYIKSWLIFCWAILTHNPALLFFPLLAFFKTSQLIYFWKTFILSIIVLSIILGLLVVIVFNIDLSLLVLRGNGFDLGPYIAFRDIGLLFSVLTLTAVLVYRTNATEFFDVLGQQLFCFTLVLFFLIFFSTGELDRLFFYITVILFPQVMLLLNYTLGKSVKARLFTINFMIFLPYILIQN